MLTSELIERLKRTDPLAAAEVDLLKKERDHYWGQCDLLLSRIRRLKTALVRITNNHNEAAEIAQNALDGLDAKDP